MKIFLIKFKQRKDIGREYFEGDKYEMIEIIDFLCKDPIQQTIECPIIKKYECLLSIITKISKI